MRRWLLASALVVAPLAWAAYSLPSPAADRAELRLPNGSQRVTLRLRAMKLSDALRLIAERARLSFVVAPDVVGTVDVDFFNEELDHIFSAVLMAHNLHVQKVGNSYLVAKGPRGGLGTSQVFPLSYANAENLQKVLESALTGAGQPDAGKQLVADKRANALVASGSPAFLSQVAKMVERLDRPMGHRIFRLNYLKAEEAATILSTSLFADAKDVGVKFVPILRENALMVVGTNEDLQLAGDLLARLDRKLRQVLIEVKLVELNGTANNLLGVTFNGDSGTLQGNWGAGETGGTIDFDPMRNALSQLRVRVNALVRDNKAKLLASPSLLAMDSKESSLEITDDIIQTVTTETTVNANNVVQRQNVTLGVAGITLKLTPKVNPDHFIAMRVEPTISFVRETVRGTASNDIIATLRSQRKLVTPEVRIKDGETLIMGGLNQERNQENVDKMPILGDIPFLGAAFRRTDYQRVTTELVVMITPKLIPDSSELEQRP